MKHIVACAVAVLGTVALLNFTCLPVSASSDVSNTDGDYHGVSIAYDDIRDSNMSQSNEPLSTSGFYPFDIEYSSYGNYPIVIKHFKVPAGTDAEGLVTPFSDAEYDFEIKDILQKESDPLTETKTVSEVVSFSSEDNKDATIRNLLQPIVEFNEGGFAGQLVLDYGSVVTEPAGTATYSYQTSKTVDMYGLDRNDYIYLPKQNGNMVLQGADWQSHGTSQSPNSVLPSNYSAEAVYSGIAYGTRVTGYEGTAVYTGTVSRTTPGDVIYSIVYQGEKIEMPVEGNSSLAAVVTVVLLLLLGAAGLLLFLFVFRPRMHKKRDSTDNGSGNGPVPLS